RCDWMVVEAAANPGRAHYRRHRRALADHALSPGASSAAGHARRAGAASDQRPGQPVDLPGILSADDLADVFSLEFAAAGGVDLWLEAAKAADGAICPGDDLWQLDFCGVDDHQAAALHAAEFQLAGIPD